MIFRLKTGVKKYANRVHFVAHICTFLHEKKPENQHNSLIFRLLRGVGRDRTADTRIFSPLLYRLSYRTFFLLRSFAQTLSRFFGRLSYVPALKLRHTGRTFAKAPVRRRTKTFLFNGLQTRSFGPARCSLGESGQQK